MEAEKWGCGEVGCKLSCPSWCLCVECRVYSVSVSVSCCMLCAGSLLYISFIEPNLSPVSCVHAHDKKRGRHDNED